MPTLDAEEGLVLDVGTAVPPLPGEQIGQLQTKQYETLSSSDIDTLTIGTGASPSLTIQRVVGGSTVGSWQWTMDGSNNLVLDRVTGTGIYVWNEVGASVDFRMEGDTDTEVFFLDGSENRIGISKTDPAVLFDVGGAANFDGAVTLKGAVTLGDAAGDNITVSGTVTSNLIFTDDSYDIGASGATRPRNLYLSGLIVTVGDLSLDGDLDFVGPQAITTTTGDLTLNPAGDVVISDNLIVSGTGPHAFGGATVGHVRHRLFGSFTSGGASTAVYGLLVDGTITGFPGDTTFLTGQHLGNAITTQTATETIAVISQLRLTEPSIIDNLTGDITVATTVHIVSAPTEGEFNYALWVDDGLSRFDSSVFINETTNANMILGQTIQQGGADNQILAFKSSDTNHLITSERETDDYGFFQKIFTTGGLGIHGANTDGAGNIGIELEGIGGGTDTTKDSTAVGHVLVTGAENVAGTITVPVNASGNIFVVRYTGASTNALFIVDKEGDLHATTADTGGTIGANTFDAYDDAALVRAFDTVRSPDTLIRTAWDEHVRYNEDTLIDLGILGGPLGTRPLINITQLQRLHNGAIWQAYVERQEMKEVIEKQLGRIKKLERLLAA